MIDILMATYNGEKFLEEQIRSLLDQTYQEWKLILRDDGSNDKTLHVIEQFISLYPDKITRLYDQKGRLGSTLSFAELLNHSKADYMMFCDQDDVWLPDKISVTLNKMLELEKKNPATPLLVFTDLSTTDDALRITNPSFMTSQKFFPEIIRNPTKLLALNIVTGCTVMINKLSRNFILPIPSANIGHDQWMAVNLAHYGKIDFIPRPTVLYRQHGNNAVGSNRIGSRYFLKKILKPAKQLKIYRNLIIHLKFRVNV
ncbi:MAG TPA: glycosyltransferase family 2 protein, partial [Chitinophagaceae bacterium]